MFVPLQHPKISAAPPGVEKRYICPLYGGGRGNAHTATEMPRTPKQRVIFLPKISDNEKS